MFVFIMILKTGPYKNEIPGNLCLKEFREERNFLVR
jgi:hypothetical protein